MKSRASRMGLYFACLVGLSEVLFSGVGATSCIRGDTGKAISFRRDVRPILSEHCFPCHGFDEPRREAGLRLDQRDSATGELDSGAVAIVPGRATASELVSRITNTDNSMLMPPPEFGKPLTIDQIAILKQWINQDAVYQKHWSFETPQRPEVPTLDESGRCRNEVDRFVSERLRRHGLEFSVAASPETLLRRVTLDLTGLPPSIEELEQFVADPSPNRYELAVDRLLKSSRYGEHRARYWLDAARYGDTHGMARDDERSIWPYRDWVIKAFNENMPFEQFTVRQLAGDLLPNATTSDKVATGFLRCNVSTAEDGSIDDELIVNYARDRVDTVSTVWMGLTMACAACHDHKYDPISQKDYYGLVAYFNNLTEEPMNGNSLAPDPVVQVPTDAQRERLHDLERRQSDVDRRSKATVEQHLQGDFQKWMDNSLASIDAMIDQDPPPTTSWFASKSYRRSDNSAIYFDHDFGPEHDDDVRSRLDDWRELSIEDGEKIIISDDNAARFYYRTLPARFPQSVTLKLGSSEKIWKPIRWKVWLRGELIYFRQFRQLDVPFAVEISLPLQSGENELLVRASHFGGPLRGSIELATAAAVPNVDSLRGPVDAVRQGATDLAQLALLQRYYRTHVWERGRAFAKEYDQINRDRFELEAAIPVSMVCRERDELRPTFLLHRGMYDAPRDRVSRAVPAMFPQLTGETTRLDVARWLVSDEHPLTARVAVNRIWQQLFGVGLVKSSEDFGAQGEYPSHPELLDWLAFEFRDRGWDVKRLVRMIVTSETYRQSSVVAPELREFDPDNRLLARGTRYRLDAEVIRDQALFLSGLLVERIGGRSVKPPQPSGHWNAVSQPNSSTANFVADAGDARYRRSIYTFWKRTAPSPILQTFDAPTRESCVIRRERTNTPLQALALMNEQQFFEAARGLARRMLQSPDNADVRLTQGFKIVASRSPSAKELVAMKNVHRRLVSHYRTNRDEARRVSGPASNYVDAAWVMTASTLLNLSEVVTKE